MNLRTLLDDPALPALELAGLAEHTQEVKPGYGFIAVAANDEDLLRYCRLALTHGAQALLLEARDVPLSVVSEAEPEVCVCEVIDLAQRRGELAAKFYNNPSERLTCVGVTGTNGKTSVAYHVADLAMQLNQTMGYCGTLGWGELDNLVDEGMTTPNAVALQRQLAHMQASGLHGVAIEVSSHALDQNRATSVGFDIAVFTNLTRDHLDYHGTMAAYSAAKSKLFTEWPLRAAIINVDDPFGAQLADLCASPVVRIGQAGDWRWQSRRHPQGLLVDWQTTHGDAQAVVPVLADYAVANITAAMATLVALGHDLNAVVEALARMRPVPGRMEVLRGIEQQPMVVVDYAHTPDALSKVLSSLREACEGQLFCVVGCGGDRDRGKRPLMGETAADAADRCWFTSDNPRGEPAQDIIVEMLAGVVADRLGRVTQEPDRRTAIHDAINAAGSCDIVLVAGKGHEDYQEINGDRLAFDDRKVAADALQKAAGAS